MKKTLAFVLLTSVLLRLWVAMGYWQNKPLTQDAKEYLELANNLNATGAFQYDEHKSLQIESYGRAPGYPFWLAFLLRIQPTLAWLRLVEVFVSLLSTYVFFLLTREFFGFRPALSAFITATFYVPLISLIPMLLSENVWILLMLLAYLFLVRARIQPRVYAILNIPAAFLFLGLATLVRPGAVFLVPFFCYWVIRATSWKNLLLGAIVYFCILLPWNLNLLLREGRPIFVASEGGVTFWTGTHPLYSGDGDLSVNPPVQKEYRSILRQYADRAPNEKDQMFYSEGFHHIFAYPAAYAWIEVKKLVFAFIPFGASVLQTSLLHRITGIGFYLVLAGFALLAFKPASSDARVFLCGIVLSYTFMILLFFPQERFRIAMLDPVLLLFAASEISRRVKNI